MNKWIKYIVIIINIALSAFFTGSYYYVIGIVMVAFSLLACVLCTNNWVGFYIIHSQIRNYGADYLEKNSRETNMLLISIALLNLSIKIGAGIALFVEGASIVIIMIVILLASGWLIEGRQSGMSVGAAFYIAKAITKLYSFLTSIFNKIALLVVKLEFYILHIELKA